MHVPTEDMPPQYTCMYIHIQDNEETRKTEPRPQITENTVLESEHACYDACVLICMHVYAHAVKEITHEYVIHIKVRMGMKSSTH